MLGLPARSAVLDHAAEEEELMQCLFCKGPMARATAPFSVDRKGYHVHWDSLPAWVCQQCGEPYFEGDEVDRIQKALDALDRHGPSPGGTAQPVTEIHPGS